MNQTVIQISPTNPQKSKVKTLKGTTYVIPEIQENLGEGTYGYVRKIYDLKRRDLDLAVKIISKKREKQRDVVKKEREVIEKLPYCINLVNYQKYCLESANNYYFVMEYCNGGTLYDKLYKGTYIFSEKQIIDCMVQCLNGYKSLLENNIIHRDIKSQNILIHNGIYKICDFGFSKIFEKKENDDDQNADFLSLSCFPGTPLFIPPDHYNEEYYSRNIDVFSLGIILFQMLYASPTRIIENLQGNYKMGHPFFDLRGINTLNIFHLKMKNLIKDQEKAYQYLDNYIKKCQITRREEMKELLKRMICIDHKQRITFEELFNHPLFKKDLDKIQNDSYKQNVWQNILRDESSINNNNNEIKQKEEKQKELINDEFEEGQASVILNSKEIQKQLLLQKMNICELMSNSGSLSLDNNSYYLEKRTLYQNNLLNILNQEVFDNSNNNNNNINQLSNDLINPEQQNYQYSNNSNSENEINPNQQNIIQNQNKSNQSKEDINNNSNKQNNKNEPNIIVSKLINLNIEDQNKNQDEKSKDITSLMNMLDDQIKQSDIRISNQHTIQKIEEILQFFRSVQFIYKQIANELSKAYKIVKDTSIQIQAELINLFNHVSILSLIMFKYQMINLKKNYSIFLLDRDLFNYNNNNTNNNISNSSYVSNNNNNNSQNEMIECITDEELIIYKQSIENTLFNRQIDQDLIQLQEELDSYLIKQEFNKLFDSYSSIVTSHSVTKDIYRDYISQLIKLGIEEYGFLDESNYNEFQKTLILLTEIDLYEKNNKLFYQKYSFSKDNLNLKFEQLEINHDLSSQLLQYCQEQSILLVAQTD